MEYDADLRPLPWCKVHGTFIEGVRASTGWMRCPKCYPHGWLHEIPRFYDPLDDIFPRRGSGKSAKPNNLVIYTTHSSEKARRQYLHFVSLMEDERYNSAHLQAYAHSWPNP